MDQLPLPIFASYADVLKGYDPTTCQRCCSCRATDIYYNESIRIVCCRQCHSKLRTTPNPDADAIKASRVVYYSELVVAPKMDTRPEPVFIYKQAS